MQFQIVVNSNLNNRVCITPENEADKKLLEFLSEHKTAVITIERKRRDQFSGYREKEEIEQIKFVLDKPSSNPE